MLDGYVLTANPTRVAMEELQLQDLKNMEAERNIYCEFNTNTELNNIPTCRRSEAERQSR